MAVKTDYLVRSALTTDQQALSHLIHFGPYVHRHLDWRNPVDWIGSSPYFVIQQNNELVGALACPPDPPEIAWVRLFAITLDADLEQSWSTLWDLAYQHLSRKRVPYAAIILLQDWFRDLLLSCGFVHHQQIVMLEYHIPSLSSLNLPKSVAIEQMIPSDIPAAVSVDKSAFPPLWQNSEDALRRAYAQAVSATVAKLNGDVVGYQISTRNSIGAHLARLAVKPEAQGTGVGSGLVTQMISGLSQRGIHRVTVNTQSDNLTSLALYQKIGFHETNENYPVYQLSIA